MSRRVMYAVYRTKRRGNDNVPLAIFDSKGRAESFKKSYEPTWCNVKWWIGRVWVEDARKDMTVYTVSEHVGYRSLGFRKKITL